MFEALILTRSMGGPLSDDSRLAVARSESLTNMRNPLLHDSNWTSRNNSFESRTSLFDAWLLTEFHLLPRALRGFPNKTQMFETPQQALSRKIIQNTQTDLGILVGLWLSA